MSRLASMLYPELHPSDNAAPARGKCILKCSYVTTFGSEDSMSLLCVGDGGGSDESEAFAAVVGIG